MGDEAPRHVLCLVAAFAQLILDDHVIHFGSGALPPLALDESRDHRRATWLVELKNMLYVHVAESHARMAGADPRSSEGKIDPGEKLPGVNYILAADDNYISPSRSDCC